MGGGLLQLVAKGAQDVYLINDPQITLFKNYETSLVKSSSISLVKSLGSTSN